MTYYVWLANYGLRSIDVEESCPMKLDTRRCFGLLLNRLMMKPLLTTLVLITLGGCAPQASDNLGQGPQISMHDLMNSVLDPATDVIWGASGTIITQQGSTELAPTTPEGWQAVYAAGALVAESGNLLLVPGRAMDDGAWLDYSQALGAIGKEAMAAALAEDADAIFEIGGRLYNVCVACHLAYPTDP